MQRFLKHVLNWACGLLVFCFLLFLLLRVSGVVPYIVLSGSMEPAIRTGSVCFVNTKADYDKMEEGDIIAFTTSGHSLVTHRVVKITEKGMETKGDANECSDGVLTTPETFKGQTLFSIPYLGYLSCQLQKLFQFF